MQHNYKKASKVKAGQASAVGSTNITADVSAPGLSDFTYKRTSRSQRADRFGSLPGCRRLPDPVSWLPHLPPPLARLPG